MSDMSLVKRRQENLWMLGRAYKLARESAMQTRALLIEALSVQQRQAYEQVVMETNHMSWCYSWTLVQKMEISQSAASDLLRALHEVGLLERCEKDENGGFGYVVSGG